MPWLKPGVLTGAMAPAAAIAARAWTHDLGADPIAQALNQLGLVALVLLVGALVCTPAKALFGWTSAMRLRRMLGLLGFFYAVLHVATYVALDQGFDWPSIFADLVKRKFIFAGFAAFAMLVPLAATSTNGSVKRLGFARWKRLHRLAYLAPAVAVLHFVWRVKRDVREPVAYAVLLGALLGLRLLDAWRSRPAALARAPSMR
jgi:methionine sulfoxide reductase heme-binding subunit